MDTSSILTELASHLLTPYLMSVIMLTFALLYFIIPTPKTWVKKVVHLVVGIVLAIVWHYTASASIDNLIFNFLLSVFLYTWFIKLLTDKFNIDYNNGMGLYFQSNNTKPAITDKNLGEDLPKPDTPADVQTNTNIVSE